MNATGLESLTSLTALSINSSTLADLSGLSNLAEVGSIFIRTEALTELPLPALDSALGLYVNDTASLLSLSGMSNLAELYTLEVEENADLQTVGLSSLTTTLTLSINDNPSLTTLGLPAVTSVSGDVTITNNPLLPQCEVDAFIATVQAAGGIDGTITTSGNDDTAVCE